ncbi:Atrial natriuretic peptide-converting enzyme [Ooceraea biroi]|nr:Atrial natriuretic peptide-converting enzyme [Ooceraea biroi]
MFWGCALVVIIIVIVAVVVGTGVMQPQVTTESLENVGENNTHQFNDIHTAGFGQGYVKNPPSSPPPFTSSFPPWPTTDETLYQTVPNALDGILRLDNLKWSNDLSDTKSQVYRQVSAEIENHLAKVLQNIDNMPVIRVYDIKKNGDVKFRMSHPPSDTVKQNQKYIEDALHKNGDMVGRYYLIKLQVEELVDQCEHGNLECTGSCEYNYFAGIFACTCSPGKMLDKDGKTCVDDNDLSNVEMDDAMPQTSTEPIHDFVQGRSRDPSVTQFEPRHPNTWERPDFKPGSTETSTSRSIIEHVDSQSEEHTTSTPTTKDIHEYDSHWNHEHSHHSADTTSESELSVKISSTEEPEPAAEPTAEPEPIKPEFAEPESAAEPEPTAEPQPAAVTEPSAEPESTIKPESASTESPVQADPTARPESTTTVSELATEPKLVSEQEPTAEPEPKPAIESETTIESITIESEIVPSVEPITVAEPAATSEEIGNNVKSQTESDHLTTTESYMESNTKISISQSESTAKPFNDNTESSTQTDMDISTSLTDSINENDDAVSSTTTIKSNDNQMDDEILLEVLPISKNDSAVINDNVETKMESTTIQTHTSEDDKITTKETDFTTVNYENLKQDGDENVALINKNNKISNTTMEQSTQSPVLQEDKNTDSIVKTNIHTNVQNESSLISEHDSITEQPSIINANISEESDSSTMTNITPVIPMEDKTDSTTRSPLNRHFHTIEINGVSMNSHNNPKSYETTTLSGITSADVSTPTTSDRQEENTLQPELRSKSDTQDSNERNVIEHMPTTIFPKVPENFAHNVEPLKEPVVKSTDDEHIMLISKSQPPVELHSIIPELIPELSSQTTNETLRVENSMKINLQESANDTVSSTERSDENIVHASNSEHTIRPDEVQEHSTSHPLHPAIFPENSVDHFAIKPDANDERHVEDMSPFLPDVQKEKESAKAKAPRLDKDEQDVPNPFETHIDDVITHRPLLHVNADDTKHKVNETESKDLLNDVNLHSPSDGGKVDTSKKTEENRKTNVVDDNSAKNAIKNDLDISEATNGTESKIPYALHQDGDSAKADAIDVTKDIIDKKNNTSFENNEALKVIPLMVGDKSVDSTSQTTMQSRDNKTIDESAKVTTLTVKKAEEGIGDFVVESRVNSSEKPEENAVEDHYNDITDETLSKGYRHDHIGKDIPIKIIDESRKTIFRNVDPERVPYKDIASPTISFDAIKEKNRPDKEILSDTTKSPVITKMEGLDNQTEIVRLTTQEPVLPMEIQQEMSTTVATDKLEITTVIDDGKREENNTEQPNLAQSEKEAVTTAQITTQSTLETARTTAQVPILPEELQTTETTDALTTSPMPTETEETKQTTIDKTESKASVEEINDEAKENENAVTHSVEADTYDTSSERNMAATTVYESNVSLRSGQKIGHDTDEQNRTEGSTESMRVQTTPMTPITERSITASIGRTSTAQSDVVTEDVRPVTEVIDDTQPMIEFDYRTLFMTTTPKAMLIQPDPDELPEEALTVIPLEKSQESKKKPADKKGFDKYKYKKEKDLTLEDQDEENGLTESPNPTTLFQTELPRTVATRNDEELSDSAVSSDIDPSVPRFVLADTKGNILPISKLKNIARPDSSKPVETKGTTVETKNKAYPSFIPVSEEIIDSAPVTESYANMRNYTYHPMIVPGVFRTTIVNETSNKDPTDRETDSSHIAARTSETIEQPVALPTDQSSDNVHETEVDSVTKKPSTIRVIVETTPLNAGVESVTAAVSSSPEPNTTPNTIVHSKCNAGQFQCVNGTSRNGAYCVPLSAKCDSENDCSDGSDEVNCEAEGCPGNFRCASGQCLKRHLVCNKIMDCDDGSDERDCDHWKCQSDEFKCPNGRCIPELWRCNGRSDCEGHQDEHNCAESCGNDEYLCPTEKWCIPQTWRCNGVAECVDGEDEKLCECDLDQFKCQTGGCIPLFQICDSVGNCPDHSDEWDCLIANITADRTLTNTEMDANADGSTTSESDDRVPLLKIRQYNDDYQLVCSDGWSEEFSDSYCRALGFAGAETTERSAWNKEQYGQEILRLKTNPNHRRPLVTNLEQVGFCVSEKVVRVSCQEFTCGLHYADGPTARLAGGIPASNGQWSSVALLKELKHGAACTASILGPMHALASYSCIHRYKESNEWQLFTSANMVKGYSVKNIMPYPQVKYNQFLYNNDIVLIELEEPLIFSRNVSAACLPRQTIQPRQICVTAGWGFSVNGEMDLQQYLKFLPVPTYDSDKCNATDHYAGFITKHDICAVGFTDVDKGPSYNDEGAPLICVSASEKWEIQGLLSHHSRSRDHPAVYSSLEPVLSWLRKSVPALRT